MRLKGAAIWMGVVIARIVEDWDTIQVHTRRSEVRWTREKCEALYVGTEDREDRVPIRWRFLIQRNPTSSFPRLCLLYSCRYSL